MIKIASECLRCGEMAEVSVLGLIVSKDCPSCKLQSEFWLERQPAEKVSYPDWVRKAISGLVKEAPAPAAVGEVAAEISEFIASKGFEEDAVLLAALERVTARMREKVLSRWPVALPKDLEEYWRTVGEKRRRLIEELDLSVSDAQKLAKYFLEPEDIRAMSLKQLMGLDEVGRVIAQRVHEAAHRDEPNQLTLL